MNSIERRDCWMRRRHRVELLGKLEATSRKQQPHITVGKDADEPGMASCPASGQSLDYYLWLSMDGSGFNPRLSNQMWCQRDERDECTGASLHTRYLGPRL